MGIIFTEKCRVRWSSQKRMTLRSIIIKCSVLWIFLFICPYVALAQKKLNGKVSDAGGVGMPGVTIRLKGTTTGTTTDNEGKYSLAVSNLEGTVEVIMVGYTTQTIPLKGRSLLNVVLEESNSQLDDVVVVGFGKQKRTDMIGSVTSVKPSDLKVPSSNLTTALAGRVAGVIGFQRSGEPGADNADFFIRGVTTFGYKVDPLILIDNVEVTTTDLARLQVDDIASFSIMKDATSTAVYGARGANGVILITTKEGVEGKTTMSFRLENSLSTPTKKVALADPITYMKLHNEAVLTRNSLALPYELEKIEMTASGADPNLYPVTDWQNELLNDYAVNKRLNLNVSGGGKVARFFVSGALNQDNGILKVPKLNNYNSNIDLKTYSLRSNININLTNTTQMSVRLNGSFDDYSGPLEGGTRVYRDIMRTNPVLFAPYYEPGDNYAYLKHVMYGNFKGESGGLYLNPYANMTRGYRNYSRSMMLAQIELNQKLAFLTEGLTFRVLGNTTRNAYFEITRSLNPFFYQMVGVDNADGSRNYNYAVLNEGREFLDYSEGDRTVSSLFYLESALNYSRTFANKHAFSGLLVSIMRNRLDGNTGSLQQSLPYRNLGLSGRFTYSYDSRYFTEFNFGYNGSERFHESQRFGFFPSAGIAWSVSNEKFWEAIKPVVSNLRLRATYGLVGNDAIGSAADRFYYLSEIDMTSSVRSATFGLNRGTTLNGITVNRYANPDITWEKAYKTNLAIELGLFKKVDFQIDLFREHRKNIFMTREYIGAQLGLASKVAANVGEAIGKGIDASVNYAHSFPNQLWIQGTANFTYAHSTYLNYEEPDYSRYPWLSRIGKPISGQFGYVAERLFIDDTEVLNSPEQSFGTALGGDIKYKDINGDGIISTLDRTIIGKPTTPEINYGFGFSLGFKNFDASMFFQGLANESFWINTAATAPFTSYTYSGESFASGTKLQNQLLKAYADNYWSEERQDIYAIWPRLSATPIENNRQTSTWFMRDGTFLRLKQAEIGYTLPKAIGNKLKISKARVYLNGSNLLVWSKFDTWDVEMAGNGLGYPVQRVFNIGLQMTL